MKQRIELHDSQIENVIVKSDTIEIIFQTLVVLNVTDEFGFEFDKTTYSPGTLAIKEARYKSLPSKGDIFDGHLLIGEYRYDLIPVDLKVNKPCALFISQESGDHLIFGKEISVTVK